MTSSNARPFKPLHIAVNLSPVQFRHGDLAGMIHAVLLETGPGHAIRCIPTPYADVFEAEKRKLKAEGKSPLEVGIALERMNLGRLRVGAASTSVVAAPLEVLEVVMRVSSPALLTK